MGTFIKKGKRPIVMILLTLSLVTDLVTSSMMSWANSRWHCCQFSSTEFTKIVTTFSKYGWFLNHLSWWATCHSKAAFRHPISATRLLLDYRTKVVIPWFWKNAKYVVKIPLITMSCTKVAAAAHKLLSTDSWEDLKTQIK